MPNVYLDDTLIDIEDTDNDTTVGYLAELISGELKAHKRIVSAVFIDGENIADWRVGTDAGRRISSCAEIIVRTAPAELLALEGLDTVQQYLKLVSEDIADAVRMIRGGRIVSELAISSIVEAIVEIIRTIDALTQGGGRFHMALFKENPAAFYSRFYIAFEEIKGAVSAGDILLTADILEYEIKPLISEMEEKIFFSRNL